MSELKNMFRRYVFSMLTLFAIFGIGWWVSDYKTIFNGLILGSIASFFNLWSMFRFAKKLKGTVETGGGFFTSGMLARIISVSVVILISLLNPEYFHLIGTIFGLITSYFVIMIDSIFVLLKK